MLNNVIWQKLEKLYQENVRIKLANVDDEEIIIAQESVGAMFSDFYRHFLKCHKVNLLGNWTMYPISGNAANDKESVICVTKLFRSDTQTSRNHKEFYIVGSNDNDLLAMSKKGEVWILYKSGTSGADKIAANFEQFLGQILV